MRAKYSDKVWEQFAYTFEKSDFWNAAIHFDAKFVCYCCVLKSLLLSCPKQSSTSKMTVVIVGSFHGFHEQITLTWYLPVRSVFSCEACFLGSLYN